MQTATRCWFYIKHNQLFFYFDCDYFVFTQETQSFMFSKHTQFKYKRDTHTSTVHMIHNTLEKLQDSTIKQVWPTVSQIVVSLLRRLPQHAWLWVHFQMSPEEEINSQTPAYGNSINWRPILHSQLTNIALAFSFTVDAVRELLVAVS